MLLRQRHTHLGGGWDCLQREFGVGGGSLAKHPEGNLSWPKVDKFGIDRRLWKKKRRQAPASEYCAEQNTFEVKQEAIDRRGSTNNRGDQEEEEEEGA